jgi:hypothetical protein
MESHRTVAITKMVQELEKYGLSIMPPTLIQLSMPIMLNCYPKNTKIICKQNPILVSAYQRIGEFPQAMVLPGANAILILQRMPLMKLKSGKNVLQWLWTLKVFSATLTMIY